MTYGLRNKATGQVEQLVEETEAEAQDLCGVLNADPRKGEPPMYLGERVEFEVVEVEDPPPPDEPEPEA